MNRKKIIAYHILAWTICLLYLVADWLLIDGGNPNMPFSMSLTVIRAIEFYFCYSVAFPLFMKWRSIPVLLIGILCALALFTGLRYAVEEVAYFRLFGFHNYGSDTTAKEYILDNLFWGSSYIFIAAGVFGMERVLGQEQENRELKKEKIRAELAFLQSQVNPHFLYNTLNYLYYLAYPASEKAAGAILKLSELMRYMLAGSQDGKVDLEQEVQYIENYIALFSMRFEENFFVTFDVSGEVTGKRIAPLLLIPFVENAFKHGVTDDPVRPVKIRIAVQDNRVALTVSNKKNTSQKDANSGVGLVNVRRRLALLYPDHELLISDNGQTYKTELLLKTS
jgi:two-component system, LytTR family, sensor kinase